MNAATTQTVSPRLILVDQSLTPASTGGHHLTYNGSLAEAARKRGLEAIILANLFASSELRSRPDVRPTFSSTWYNDGRPYGLVPTGFGLAPVRDVFADELLGALASLRASPADQLFLHTLGFYEMGELLRAILGQSPVELPVIHILCRRDLREAGDGPARREFEFAVAALARNRDRGIDIRFYTDTPQLSLQYTTATRVLFETLPLPFPTQMIADRLGHMRKLRAGRAQTRFCYLGDARDEKGYQHLPGAIMRLAAGLPDASAVHFTLQSNFNVEGGEPLSGPARRKLSALSSSLVELRPTALSDHDYYDVLCDSDAVLVPYDVTCYENRSSGIFTEAMHAETIPIVPAGTSMAAQLPPGFPAVFHSPRELAGILEAIHRDKHRLRGLIEELATSWRAIHTPEDLLDRLVNRPPKTLVVRELPPREGFAYGGKRSSRAALPAEAPRVLVQIDLESFHYRVGAARTMTLQIRALQQLGCAVYVVAVVHHNLNEAADPAYRPSFWAGVLDDMAVEHELAGTWLCWNGRVRPEGKLELGAVLAYRRGTTSPQGLRDFLRVAPPAFVLVNYAQNMSVIDKLGLGDLPLAIETHDVQSHEIALSIGTTQDKSLATEIELLRRAKLVSAVTEEDAAFLRRQGLTQARCCIPLRRPAAVDETIFAGIQDLSELLAAGGSEAVDVDIERAWRQHRVEQIKRLHRERTLDIVFVGSWHRPNIEGFEWFYREVFRPFLERAEVNCFVLGGICIERDRFPSDRIFWGGTQRDVGICLAAARIVIAPLLDGTGINVKALEAIENGKPMVATSVALRGIPGAKDILRGCDEAKDFADRILTLLASRSKREKLSAATRAFGDELRARNDYALHYATMLPAGTEVIPTAAEAKDNMPSLLEYTSSHERANRLIRVMAEDGGAGSDLYRLMMDRLSEFSFPDPFLTFVRKLYVEQNAPILAIKGFAGKHRLDLLAAASTEDVLFKMVARLAEAVNDLSRPAALAALGARSIGEFLQSLGAPCEAEGHVAQLCRPAPHDGPVARIAEDGFDIVLWFGPNNWCQDAVAWVYNEVIKPSPILRECTILIPGPASMHRFLDGHVYFCGDIRDSMLLPLLGRVIVLGAEGSRGLHPDWIRTSLVAAAAGTKALAVDLLIFGDAGPKSLGFDRKAWEQALIQTVSRPRPEGSLTPGQRRMLRQAAPKLADWLEEAIVSDIAWSGWMGRASESLILDSAPSGDAEIEGIWTDVTDARRRRTIMLHLETLIRRIENAGQQVPAYFEALLDRLEADEVGSSDAKQ